MSDIIAEIQKVLAEYDSDIKPITEYDVSDRICKLLGKDYTSELPMQWNAETWAFAFQESKLEDNKGRSTFYGPLRALIGYDEYPSIGKITPEIIDYWTDRATSSRHPVLKTRYADLVWDLSKKVKGAPASHTMAQQVIDSTIEMAWLQCHKYKTTIIRRLRRALSLSLSLGDDESVARVRDAVIVYEDAVAEDDKEALWGFSFDMLLLDNPKVKVSEDIRLKLVGDLEARLGRFAAPDRIPRNPWGAEDAAMRLARHYRKEGRAEDVRRVLLVYEQCFQSFAAQASAMQASAWLRGIHAVFADFGLADDARRIAVQLRELGPRCTSEMKPVTFTTTIPEEEMRKYIEVMTEGSLHDSLLRVAAKYFPDRSVIEEQLSELAEAAPLMSHLTIILQDHKGRPVASVDDIDSDLDGRVAMQMSHSMKFSAMSMRLVLAEIFRRNNVTAQVLAEYICRSPVFEEGRCQMLEHGLQLYLSGDHLASAHVLIPCIENAFRLMLEKLRGDVLKPARNGGMQLKTLDELLRSPKLLEFFGEDRILYFRVLLTDQRGWNLRNDVCHGLTVPEAFGTAMTDRLLHVLLCLAQVRAKQQA
ncbi:MAG TPA: hypothetical protein DCZ94_08840 [Lentisphaeria bacterium]|nr:MAG: hypothetical protein A2X48_23560 [Lentisphaerae bacterium GWF2_49_21]HBC87046.1 hypothetical protein [Lentisphaeria bacterium]